MATTIEHMQADADAAAGPPAPAAGGDASRSDVPAREHGPPPPAAPSAATQPAALDDATLERLAAIFRADQRQPDRPTWQSSLLTALVAALLAAAVPGFLSLRSDISELGTGLRAENAAMEEGLRTEIGSLRADIGKLRADMIAAWEGQPLVTVRSRPLRYQPIEWSMGKPIRWRAEEKGIDVMMALDIALGARDDLYDVAVVTSPWR